MFIFSFAKLRLCVQVAQLLCLQYLLMPKRVQMNKINISQPRHTSVWCNGPSCRCLPSANSFTMANSFCSQTDSYWHGTTPGWENRLFGTPEGVQWNLQPVTLNQEGSSEAATSHGCKLLLLHKVLPLVAGVAGHNALQRLGTGRRWRGAHRDAAPQAAAPCPGRGDTLACSEPDLTWGWGS